MEGGVFLASARFGHFRRAPLLLLSVIVAVFGGRYFVLFWCILAIFIARCVSYFSAFSPFSEDGVIIVILIGLLEGSNFLFLAILVNFRWLLSFCKIFSALLAIWRVQYFYCFRAFWLISEASIFIQVREFSGPQGRLSSDVAKAWRTHQGAHQEVLGTPRTLHPPGLPQLV